MTRGIFAGVLWLVAVLAALVTSTNHALLVIVSLSSTAGYVALVIPSWNARRLRWLIAISLLPLIFLALNSFDRLSSLFA